MHSCWDISNIQKQDSRNKQRTNTHATVLNDTYYLGSIQKAHFDIRMCVLKNYIQVSRMDFSLVFSLYKRTIWYRFTSNYNMHVSLIDLSFLQRMYLCMWGLQMHFYQTAVHSPLKNYLESIYTYISFANVNLVCVHTVRWL